MTSYMNADRNQNIMFTAHEMPLYFDATHNTRFVSIDTHKALVRNDYTSDGTRINTLLNIVGKNYGVVQNSELFRTVENRVMNAMHLNDTQGMQRIDRMSFNGRKCYRQYVFPQTTLYTNSNSKPIAFRIIVENAFGGGSLKIHCGAIDFFCTNGMITGDYSSTYIRHTSGVKMMRVDAAVAEGLRKFKLLDKTLQDLKELSVTQDNEKVVETVSEKFGSKGLGNKLWERFQTECYNRGGRNMWNLYSACTHWASHNDEYPLKKTDNDHEVSSMLGREKRVAAVWRTGELLQELAA
jgi:hypothetical protein